MRRAAKVDDSQPRIVRAMRAVGATVISLAGLGDKAPDLLVGFRHQTYLFEVKTPGREMHHRQHAIEQAEWRAKWPGGPVHVVSTPEQALRIMAGFQEGDLQPRPPAGALEPPKTCR